MAVRLPSQQVIRRCGIIAGIFFLLSMGDTFVSGHLDDGRLLRALPGTRYPINGTLTATLSSFKDLSYRADDSGLRLVFQDLRGRIWRGELQVAESVQPGSYSLQVLDSLGQAVEAADAHRVVVFDSQAALNASYPSICRKILGIPPWWVVILSLPPLVGALLLSYLHSSQQEALLARQGIFPILKLARLKDQWEVGIGIHDKQKIFTGDLLRLLNARLEPVGELRIQSVREKTALALLDLSADIAPDYYVQKPFDP